MKPINEMTLQECLNEMRSFTQRYENCVLAKYDEPTQELDELLNRITELTRWIPVGERLPTKEDADERGKVLWLFWGEHYESRYWDLRRDYGITHWRRIDKPEGN